MNAENCLSELRKIRDVAFATVDEENRPQVRIIDVMLVENDALYFCTARGKEFYRQLTKNGQVAVVGMNEKYQMIRINGQAIRLSDQTKWIDRIFEENPSMNEVYPGESRAILEAFCLKDGEAEIFDLGVSPIFRQGAAVGKGRQTPKGFWIDKGCAECGACKTACPQDCIEEGTPYQIRQENCLHCGLCQEVCPTNSVRRREL